MRISKLHILFFVLIIGVMAYSFYFLKIRGNGVNGQKRDFMAAKNKIFDAAQDGFDSARTIVEDEVLSAIVPEEEPVVETYPDLEEVDPIDTESAYTNNSSDLSDPETYIVQKGDTLWSIAKKEEYFSQGHRWYDIWKANEDIIFDFDKVKVGQNLVIPLDKPDGYPWPITSQERKMRILGQSTEHNGF